MPIHLKLPVFTHDFREMVCRAHTQAHRAALTSNLACARVRQGCKHHQMLQFGAQYSLLGWAAPSVHLQRGGFKKLDQGLGWIFL